ncbi:Metallo-dependent phosphatase [Pleurostoma richardsiae]|uniref:Metallo-dependent phosphatase n=1 Tax=Pleurostoma richardsiae TaxID=41990 RepID=A0AA38VJ17_9PEZI|nr:Metallo-dependent phosphatase [Pleurostoma richardsiae]
MSSSSIKTRLLIISDTHGASLFEDTAEEPRSSNTRRDNDQPTIHGFRRPLPSADVAIHCGDLTKSSSSREYQATFDLMRSLDAPLKLLIAGNHDIALDPEQLELLPHRRRRLAPIAELLRGLRAEDGIHLLDEGAHHFVLRNGARLAVYASPYTPEYGGWAFQYRGRHEFAIPPGTDVAVTHGPPRGVLDRSYHGSGAGCEYLMESVARARPRVHCFGHIHEAWGAKLVTWEGGSVPSASVGEGSAVDEEKSVLLEDLGTLEGTRWDDLETRRAKKARAETMARSRCAQVSLCQGDERRLESRRQTLFVNAAIMDVRYRPYQLPWLIDIDLPPPDEEHISKAEATAARLREPTTTASIEEVVAASSATQGY